MFASVYYKLQYACCLVQLLLWFIPVLILRRAMMNAPAGANNANPRKQYESLVSLSFLSWLTYIARLCLACRQRPYQHAGRVCLVQLWHCRQHCRQERYFDCHYPVLGVHCLPHRLSTSLHLQLPHRPHRHVEHWLPVDSGPLHPPLPDLDLLSFN
ncbi:hypothetical protein DSO57_1030255 [Entomophthora muscae]|uniref:Uncharacterized protein n=2 Tax=Entomophthora muscae TaxID=34485 RepID=A0ACC2SYQ6_9FUNG|nr:hypothetical protein DSO57_1039086 [Entomophthora muscae]KAJ9087735.1 hypothetical protein DSO57_1030255 [Entomophthora muscae]